MIKVEDKFLPILARFFSRSTILEFLYKKEPKYILDTLKNAQIDLNSFSSQTYGDFFDLVYQTILDKYMCEYIYKNETLSYEILSNKHTDDAKLLSEVIVGKSKADIVIVNGTTTVYEIKTELDNVSRLESQLDDYLKVFDRVNVLTCENQLKHVYKLLQSKLKYSVVGVCLFSVKNGESVISTNKESESNLMNLDPLAIYNVLNFSELRKYDPNLTKEDFISMNISEINTLFNKIMRVRAKNQNFIESMPKSLKMMGSSLQKLSMKDRNKLVTKLERAVIFH